MTKIKGSLAHAKSLTDLATSAVALATDLVPVQKSGEPNVTTLTLAQIATLIETGGLTSALPSLDLIDSDTTDGDVSATLAANATDTGTGAEDIDVTLSAQIAGTLEALFTYDASADTFTFNRDLTLATATPKFNLIDTSTDDDDVSAEMEATATATGTGAEDVDVFFRSQIGGAMTEYLSFDASDKATKLAENATAKLGIFGATPVVQASALTAAETTLTNAGSGGDSLIQALTNSTPFGFVTAAEGEQVVETVLNNQLLIAEIKTILANIGLSA